MEDSLKLARWIRDAITADSDSLAAHRDRIMLMIGVVAVLVLTPFAINNIIQGRATVAFVVVLIQAVMVIDCYALYKGRRPPVPFVVLFAPILIGVTSVIVVQGMPGVLWAYPIVVFCYFVFQRRAANYCSVAFFFYVCALTAVFVEPAMAFRLAGTLLFTLVMMNIMLSVITELHDELSSEALTDALTGAFNRRFMMQELSALVSRFRRNPHAASVLVIDVDYFKRINDTYGHGIGDQVLRSIVGTVATRVRSSDRIFRWGGEEFVLVAEDTTLAGATSLAEALRRAISEALVLDGGGRVTVSIGVCQLTVGHDVDSWLKDADAALYTAKQGGRNRVIAVPFASGTVGDGGQEANRASVDGNSCNSSWVARQ